MFKNAVVVFCIIRRSFLGHTITYSHVNAGTTHQTILARTHPTRSTSQQVDHFFGSEHCGKRSSHRDDGSANCMYEQR